MSAERKYNAQFEKAYLSYGRDLGLHRDDFAQLELDFRSSHPGDLVLARACAAGHEIAWQHFVQRYRTKMYAFALSITHDAASAHDLADSLYAALYSSPPKLRSYTGIGPLEAWLRVVLAQEHVNHIRQQRRLVQLDENDGHLIAATATGSDPGREHALLAGAVDAAFARVAPENAFLLSSYYLDNRTLAEIGRMLGVHESSVSRKLKKAASFLRKQILKELQKAGVPRSAAEEMLKVDVRELQLDLRARLSQKSMAQERKQDAFL